MSEFILPTYEESCVARRKGEATALQMFISENEPANGVDEWRELLADVIDEALFDLNHDFEATLKHCDDHHVEGREL